MYLSPTHPQNHDALRLLDGEPGELETRLDDIAVLREVLSPVAEVVVAVVVVVVDELSSCTYDV